MRKLLYASAIGIGLALFSPTVLAAMQDTQEEIMAALSKGLFYLLVGFVIVVIVFVYFMRSGDKRRAPLNSIFEQGEAIHSVGPDTPVTECVRVMTAEKIGALIVMD